MTNRIPRSHIEDWLQYEAIGAQSLGAAEAYYWHNKCTVAYTAERAQKALRVLLAAE